MYKIFGKRKLDFTADDSRRIVGTTVWYGILLDDAADCDGFMVNKAFVSPDVIAYKDIPVDTEVDILFDFKGRIKAIDIIVG